MMNLHLAETSTQVAQNAIAVLTCDGAGWHQQGGELVVPDNIVLLHLPPYSPELNPIENVWDYLRQNKLCAMVWDMIDQTRRDRLHSLGADIGGDQVAKIPKRTNTMV